MKIENYQYPKSSFLSVNKDLNIIVNKILSNERLQKLLYYTHSNPLRGEDLTEDQKLSLMGRNIKITPKIMIDTEAINYIIITFDRFRPNKTNPEFRDNTIIFTIICPLDQWELGDFDLRPYRIAAELDSMLNDKRLTGIGLLEFAGGEQVMTSDGLHGGIAVAYTTIHGEEDKKGMLNPIAEQQFIKDFNEMYNG